MYIYHVFEHLEALKLAFWTKKFLSMYPLARGGTGNTDKKSFMKITPSWS